VRPGGILACWTYHLQTVSPEVDAVVRRLYADILGPFWFPISGTWKTVNARCRSRWRRFLPPRDRLVQNWDENRLVAYLGTWWGSQRF
jgi:hypothetical protein